MKQHHNSLVVPDQNIRPIKQHHNSLVAPEPETGDPFAVSENLRSTTRDADTILESELTIDEAESEHEKLKLGKFTAIFLDKHQVIGMLFDRHAAVSRAEKLTIILTILMIKLFAIGLFYDKDRDPDEEEQEKDKSVEEIIDGFGYRDFWIMLYTMCIVMPVPFILKAFFQRHELDPDHELEEIEKRKKKMKIRRIIGYIICFIICAWCIWSIVAFSISFGYNTSMIWLVNFGITFVGDVVGKDVLIACLSVLLAIYLPVLKDKCKKKCFGKDEDLKVDTSRSNSKVITPVI